VSILGFNNVRNNVRNNVGEDEEYDARYRMCPHFKRAYKKNSDDLCNYLTLSSMWSR
jgi:hypothetical protein